MNMTHSTTSDVDSSLATKCLDFCQALTRQGKNFNFSLNLGPSFKFALDTSVKSISAEMVRKKLSPSAVKRNARRKEDYLKKKSESLKSNGNNFNKAGPDNEAFQ